MKKLGILLLSILSLVVSGCSLLPSMNNGGSSEPVCQFLNSHNGEEFKVGDTIELTYKCIVGNRRVEADVSFPESNVSFVSKNTSEIVFKAINPGKQNVYLQYKGTQYGSTTFTITGSGQPIDDDPTASYGINISNRHELTNYWAIADGARTVNVELTKNGAAVNKYAALRNGELSWGFSREEIVSFNQNNFSLTPLSAGITTLIFSYHNVSDEITINISAEAEHGTSSDDPLTVQEAIDICYATGTTGTEKKYYVRGQVTNIVSYYSRSANNLSVDINDGTSAGNLRCYLNNVVNGDPHDIIPGATITTFCSLINYNNSLPEANTGSDIIEVIPNQNRPFVIQQSCSGAASIAKSLAAQETTFDFYKVTGYVAEVPDSKKPREFYLVDSANLTRSADPKDDLMIYATKCFVDNDILQVGVGEKVTVVGNAKNYVDKNGVSSYELVNVQSITFEEQITIDTFDKTVYLCQTNGTKDAMVRAGTLYNPEPNQIASYAWPIAVNAGQLFRFQIDGVYVVVTPSNRSDNNCTTSGNSTAIRIIDAATTTIEFKVFSDGHYEVFVGGRQAQTYRLYKNGAQTDYVFTEISPIATKFSKSYHLHFDYLSSEDYFTVYLISPDLITYLNCYFDSYLEGYGSNNAYLETGNYGNRFNLHNSCSNVDMYFNIAASSGDYVIFVTGIPFELYVNGMVHSYALEEVSPIQPNFSKTYCAEFDLNQGDIISFKNANSSTFVTAYADASLSGFGANNAYVEDYASSTSFEILHYATNAKIYLNYLPASDIYLVFVTGYSAPYRLFVNDSDTTCLFEETPTIAAGFEHSYELKYNFNSGDEFSIENTINGYFIEGSAPANAVETESNNAYVENGDVGNFFKIYDGGEDIYIFLNIDKSGNMIIHVTGKQKNYAELDVQIHNSSSGGGASLSLRQSDDLKALDPDLLAAFIAPYSITEGDIYYFTIDGETVSVEVPFDGVTNYFYKISDLYNVQGTATFSMSNVLLLVYEDHYAVWASDEVSNNSWNDVYIKINNYFIEMDYDEVEGKYTTNVSIQPGDTISFISKFSIASFHLGHGDTNAYIENHEESGKVAYVNQPINNGLVTFYLDGDSYAILVQYQS